MLINSSLIFFFFFGIVSGVESRKVHLGVSTTHPKGM